MIGSAPLSNALLDQMGAMFPAAKISNGYGSTEAGPAIFGPHPDDKPQPWLSVGYPLEDIQWRLLMPQETTLGATLPFFIDWSDPALHPSKSLPIAGELSSFQLTHPSARKLRSFIGEVLRFWKGSSQN